MATISQPPVPASRDRIAQFAAELAASKASLAESAAADRLALLHDCLQRTLALAAEWTDAACAAKGIAPHSPTRGEEVLAGPLATARHLRLLIQSYQDVLAHGHIVLPGKVARGPHGGLCVPVVPARGVYDAVVFGGLSAKCWLDPSVAAAALETLGQSLVAPQSPRSVLVLGAGNVSSIAATDTISKIFQERAVVLLKMNPVNEYLGAIFERLFARVIEAGWLRIIYGGAESGSAAVEHPAIDEVHITGSIHTHDAIVWGANPQERERRKRQHDPLLKKTMTSELGNVSPWIIVPGPYSDGQLRFQAENIATSIVNNASFNCVATKVLVTARDWPDRQKFLDFLEEALARVPLRRAYYPGAVERYRRFAQREPGADATGTLPWTLVRDADPRTHVHLFQEESFVCVCAEIGLAPTAGSEFLPYAVSWVNENLWGTLSAALLVHPKTLRGERQREMFDVALRDLRYGSIGINHWPGLLFAMMSPPWGGYPTGTLEDAQSGIGMVHNTFMLPSVQKTVLAGPLTLFPRPAWFPSNRNAEQIALRVLDLYAAPSAWKLPGIALAALKG